MTKANAVAVKRTTKSKIREGVTVLRPLFTAFVWLWREKSAKLGVLALQTQKKRV